MTPHYIRCDILSSLSSLSTYRRPAYLFILFISIFISTDSAAVAFFFLSLLQLLLFSVSYLSLSCRPRSREKGKNEKRKKKVKQSRRRKFWRKSRRLRRGSVFGNAGTPFDVPLGLSARPNGQHHSPEAALSVEYSQQHWTAQPQQAGHSLQPEQQQKVKTPSLNAKLINSFLSRRHLHQRLKGKNVFKIGRERGGNSLILSLFIPISFSFLSCLGFRAFHCHRRKW